VKETRGGNPPRFQSFTNAAYLAWRGQTATIDGLAAWSQRVVTLGGAGDPERIRITTASASLFPVLGVRPLIGSLFTERDESAPVVVLSEALWRGRFASDPGVLGRAVQFDGRSHTIVGVLPDAFAFPDRQSRAIVPFAVPSAAGNRLSMFHAIANLAPGATAAQAAAEGTGRGRFAADTGLTTTAIFGKPGAIEIQAEPLRDALAGDVRQPLIVLLAAVVLLLSTATANVASLQLARATTRRREMAIRAALGAGGVRVTRQLLVENVLLSSIGGALGLALAWLLHGALPTLLPADFPRLDDLRVDVIVFAFAIAISMVTGVVFGLVPALRVRRLDVLVSLSEDTAGSVGAASRSRTAQARLAIMAGQIAAACVLLVGASLLGRSFLAMLSADRGFDPSNVLTARLSFPGATYTPERRSALAGQILDRLAMQPSVLHAGFTSEMPLTPGGSTAAFAMRSPAEGGATIQAQASPRIVSPQFFAAIGMRILAGRAFLPTDIETSEPVVVVNQAFARRYLGDAPLGARIPLAGYSSGDEQVETTVVGIVDDVRYVGTGRAALPELYYSHRQIRGGLPVPVVTLLLRTAGDAARLARAIRSAVREADPTLVPESILTMDERVMTTLARPRLYAIVLGGFAAFALAIAGVGLFGVLSYAVAQRTRELALRSALGARRVDLVTLILKQGLAVTAAGLGVGLLASTWLTRGIATELYGVTTADAVTYAAVPLLLALVAAVACAGPARRAATLDPLRVLRGD
jgi:predicted permease